MGLLVDGVWHDEWYDTKSTGGRFIRTESQFRNWITKDGKPGPSGQGGFKAEKNRYHLYVCLACPWAHRTLVLRALKGLEDFISVSTVHPYMGEHGWTFQLGDGVIPDPVINADYLHQIYTHVEPAYSGRVTVPILYDLKQDTIVSNESSEIIQMLNTAFDDIGAKAGDYYPTELREAIDETNEFVYHAVNNGVYKVGFATKQSIYDEEVTQLFDALDTIEQRLSKQEFLVGNTFTLADVRLFTTLVRFDLVYVGHFKCNLRQLKEYPHLWKYTRKIYQIPGIAETVNQTHIKEHYYLSHPTINPTRIVPKGPLIDFSL